MEIKQGDTVYHKVHGKGEVINTSPSGAYVTVKYTCEGKSYSRVSQVDKLSRKKLES